MAAAGKTAGVVGRRKGPESDSVLTVAGRGDPAAPMWQVPRHGCGRPAAPMWQVPRHGCGGPAAPMWQVPGMAVAAPRRRCGRVRRQGYGGPAAPMWQFLPATLIALVMRAPPPCRYSFGSEYMTLQDAARATGEA
jgi:hypothetical protein